MHHSANQFHERVHVHFNASLDFLTTNPFTVLFPSNAFKLLRILTANNLYPELFKRFYHEFSG